jgi:hypothetical protein
VVLLDANHELAAATTLSGRTDKVLPVIALDRCGSASGRLLTEEGGALPAAPLRLGAVLTYTARGKQPEDVETNWYQCLGRGESGVTDDTGRFRLPALVPGVRYRLYATVGGSKRLAHEFSVTTGQVLALPEKRFAP